MTSAKAASSQLIRHARAERFAWFASLGHHIMTTIFCSHLSRIQLQQGYL